MNINGLEKIYNQASNFWKQQFIASPKQDQDKSTNVGSNILEEQSIFDISTIKTQKYLFPDIERQKLNKEKLEQEFTSKLTKQNKKIELQDNYEIDASCSSCSNCLSKRGYKKKQKLRSCKLTKQRFTISQEALMMEQSRQENSFKDVDEQIPETTINQVKNHQLLKKLKICNKNTDLQGDSIAEIILKIQQIQQNENLDNVNKIQELRQYISQIENHLNQTKKLILQKYMVLFQQL